MKEHRGRLILPAILSIALLQWWSAPLLGRAGGQALFETAAVEPNAGSWKTWVLASGGDFRLPPPPGPAQTQDEIRGLSALTQSPDAATLARIRFWDAGPPSYRWVELALAQIGQKPLSNPKNTRTMALLNVAIYDATIAAWDSKYFHNRRRPSEIDPSIGTAVAVPASPSYPSEHAVVAAAAMEILSYVYPSDAQAFFDAAREASYTRVLAGVQYPSDVTAGFALGKVVADRVIERARADGTDAVWTGTVPTGLGLWNGTNPIEPLAGTWKPWVLGSGSQLRPGPPPAYDSPQEGSELAEIKNFPRTFVSNSRAFYWQTFDGVLADWYSIAGRRVFEHHLEANQPRAARIYALLSVAHYDAIIACWDAKYTYWAIRPFQLDPSVVTLFATPNHPSYPAAHGAASGSISEALAYAFPEEADSARARGTEAGMSRIWAGIHFRSDVEVGLALGRAVAQQVIDRVKNDGSQ
jgi:membrane-associated phospholipid phosphatase